MLGFLWARRTLLQLDSTPPSFDEVFDRDRSTNPYQT